MKLSEVVDNQERIVVHELNRNLHSYDMLGSVLYKGPASGASVDLLSREVFRILGDNKTVFVVM